LLGEGESQVDELLVPAAGETAQLGQVGSGNLQVGWRDRHEVDLLAAQPRVAPIGGHGGRVIAQERDPDGGNRRHHGHAHFPRIDDDEHVFAVLGEDGGHARGSFGWGTVHGVGVRNQVAGAAGAAGQGS